MPGTERGVGSSRLRGQRYRVRLVGLGIAARSQQLILTVDLKEPRLLLLVLAELQLVHIVLQAEFLEGDGDLVAVGGCSTERLARSFGWVMCRLDVFFSPVW